MFGPLLQRLQKYFMDLLESNFWSEQRELKTKLVIPLSDGNCLLFDGIRQHSNTFVCMCALFVSLNLIGSYFFPIIFVKEIYF